jgi:hypothetical protein
MLGPRELMEGEFYRAGKLAVAGEVHRDRLITETEHGRAAAQGHNYGHPVGRGRTRAFTACE